MTEDDEDEELEDAFRCTLMSGTVSWAGAAFGTFREVPGAISARERMDARDSDRCKWACGGESASELLTDARDGDTVRERGIGSGDGLAIDEVKGRGASSVSAAPGYLQMLTDPGALSEVMQTHKLH